jgi:hypothetical protein
MLALLVGRFVNPRFAITKIVRITNVNTFSFHSYFQFISNSTIQFCTLLVVTLYMRCFPFTHKMLTKEKRTPGSCYYV